MNNRRSGPGAPGRILARVRQYIADLDAASLETLRRDGELREVANAERGEREAELRDEAELFTARLPAWLRRDAAGPGSRWVAAADIVLGRRRAGRPFAVRVGRSRTGMTLTRGTELRLVESHAAALPGQRTFEVIGGRLSGTLIDVAAGPADGVRRQALTAAAMVAPAGERIAEVPAAASSVLRQLEECRRTADHAEAVLRHQRRWAWAHTPARSRQADGRVERVNVRTEVVDVRVETADRRATGGEDRPPRP